MPAMRKESKRSVVLAQAAASMEKLYGGELLEACTSSPTKGVRMGAKIFREGPSYGV